MLKNRVEVSDEIARYNNLMHSRELRRRRRDKDKLVYFSDDEILDVYCNVSTMGTDEEYEQIELRHIIRDAIKNELTDLQRTAVIYVFYERYTHKQTAEIMGVSKSTVDTYIYRALAKLKKKLGNMDIL